MPLACSPSISRGMGGRARWVGAMWALLLFTYFGVNLWITGLHSYAGV